VLAEGVGDGVAEGVGVETPGVPALPVPAALPAPVPAEPPEVCASATEAANAAAVATAMYVVDRLNISNSYAPTFRAYVHNVVRMRRVPSVRVRSFF
jgi:hypothetical protein